MPGPAASFTRYVERVRRANGVDDADRQRDIFLTVIGPACYDRLVDLLAPRSPSSTFSKLTTIPSHQSVFSNTTSTTGCKVHRNPLQLILRSCSD